ncbi:unnamed protein product [Taenia asiatica]|uniref:Uncharacterized protein n=1 Tax=Taenia asiatica TaxID=60517 RepID=A0A3P6R9D6_TAEAS|nr:unnamed protein product [Taenia asiatica]
MRFSNQLCPTFHPGTLGAHCCLRQEVVSELSAILSAKQSPDNLLVSINVESNRRKEVEDEANTPSNGNQCFSSISLRQFTDIANTFNKYRDLKYKGLLVSRNDDEMIINDAKGADSCQDGKVKAIHATTTTTAVVITPAYNLE